MSTTLRWTVSRGRAAILASVVALLLLGCGDDEARERGFGMYDCDGPSRIYHGRANFVRRPCSVSADRIYEAIPEYREIQRTGISRDNPRWHLLMKKASERFNAAVQAMARKHGHDLVAERGVCRANRDGVSAPPDRTDEVLEELRD